MAGQIAAGLICVLGVLAISCVLAWVVLGYPLRRRRRSLSPRHRALIRMYAHGYRLMECMPGVFRNWPGSFDPGFMEEIITREAHRDPYPPFRPA